MSETNNKPTKFLDYEGLQKFWEVINIKFNGLFVTKTELAESKISDLTVKKSANKEFDPSYNRDLEYNLDIKIKLGTNELEIEDNNIFTASIPVVDRRDSKNNTPGLITPMMFNELINKNIPEVSSTASGLMTPAMLDKLEKSVQNKLLNDSSVTTGEDGKTYLNLKFEYTNGKDAIETIDVSDLVDVYNPGQGIEVSDDNNISIDENWLNEKVSDKVSELTGSTSTTTENIQIADGPLANDIEANDFWPSDWVENGDKIIPKNLTLQQILEGLFFREINGTADWGTPTWTSSISSPTVELSSTAGDILEVGEQITINKLTEGQITPGKKYVTCTCNYGYFDVDENGNISDAWNKGNKELNFTNIGTVGTPTFTYTWNDEVYDNVTVDSTYFVINQGNNTLKVTQSGQSVRCKDENNNHDPENATSLSQMRIPTTTVIASKNTKKPISNNSVDFKTFRDNSELTKDLTSSSITTYTGRRAYWMGGLTEENKLTTFDSDTIRNSNLGKYLDTNPKTTVVVEAGSIQVVIATQKEIENITSETQIGASVKDKFKLHEVNIEGKNKFEPTKYYVYVWEPVNSFAKKDTLTITYK